MMETFTEPNKLVSNPDFIEQKENSLDSLVISTIDSPILDIIGCLNELRLLFHFTVLLWALSLQWSE